MVIIMDYAYFNEIIDSVLEDINLTKLKLYSIKKSER